MSPSGRGARRTGPVFLERANYGYRRMTDAVRLLPLIGAILWLVPLLWTRGDTANSVALLYVFGTWLVLVVVAGLLARGLGQGGWSDEPTDPREDEGADAAPGDASAGARRETPARTADRKRSERGG